MPSASYEQRAVMTKWFGGMDDGPPSAFLQARGWTHDRYKWYKPTPSYNPSIYEVECLFFLQDEWDHDFESPLFPELESCK